MDKEAETKAIRYLYGENSGIENIECTLCICSCCGRVYVEVAPKEASEKTCHVTVDQAKTLGIYSSINFKDYTLCDGCRRDKKFSRDNLLQLTGFFFFVAAFIAAVALVAVGAQ